MSRRIPCVLIVILATLLAFHALTIHRQCYFVDEVNELAIAALPVGEIIRARDSMPPLYPLVHKAWRAVWQTDSASRWLSALFHMATVLVVWRIGHKFIDAPTGVVAAALAAICPLLLYYAQFVRAYALYVLLVALLSWCLLRARDTNRWRDWLSFVAVGLAGCYTHYYFPLFLAACALCLMLERRLLINSRAMITFGLIALVAMPLFPLVHDDLSYQRGLRENRALSPTALGYTYVSFFSGYALGPSKAELHWMPMRDAASRLLPWAGAIAVTSWWLLWRSVGHLLFRGPSLAMVLFFVVPIALAGAAGAAVGLTYHVRFVAPCAIPLMLCIAIGVVARRREWLTRLATLTLVAVMAVAIVNRHTVDRYQNEDISAAGSFLAQHAAIAETVICISNYMSIVVEYYMPAGYTVIRLPDPNAVSVVVDDAASARAAVARLPADRCAWLIYSREFHGDPHGYLLNAIETQFDAELAFESAGVKVYRLAASSAN